MTLRPAGRHAAVLVAEVLEALRAGPGRAYVDATIGQGGHAEAILAATAPTGRLLGLDRDPAAVASARQRLAPYGERCVIRQGSLGDLAAHAAEADWRAAAGVLMDLGFSSDQIEDAARGFSFQAEGRLDMRYDPDGPTTAADLVNELPEGELADLLYRFGEEHRSRRIARAIVAARPIETTTQLAAVVQRAVGRSGRTHPATRTFQALRIAVNRELDEIGRGLSDAMDLLAGGGRLAVISFHSLEDRLVKQTLRDAARDCICPPELPECRCHHRATMRLVTKKPITPTRQEIQANPRARSARLRVAERLAGAEAAA